MTNEEALDIIFSFFPRDILIKVKKAGLYDLITSKTVKDGSEIYDHLEEEYAKLQDTNYTKLAEKLLTHLKYGSLLQIGCGRGNLLMHMAEHGFKPIYGIDRSCVMLNAAQNRVKAYKDVHCIQKKIEDINFSTLPHIKNVIINNFWGILSEESSINLLKNLKQCINTESIILIGPIPNQTKIDMILANKTLKENLGFMFTYPYFDDFTSLGYKYKKITTTNGEYYLLKIKSV